MSRVIEGQKDELLLFLVEVLDLAPAREMVGRMAVMRDAVVRYLAEDALDADELRARLALITDEGRGVTPGAAALADLCYVVTMRGPSDEQIGLAAFRYPGDATGFHGRYYPGVDVAVHELPGPTEPDAIAAAVARERAAIAAYLESWRHHELAAQVRGGSGR